MTESHPAFAGWLSLDGGPWRRVCEARTEAECWGRLLRVPVGAAASVERLVNDGKHPDQRKRPR